MNSLSKIAAVSLAFIASEPINAQEQYVSVDPVSEEVWAEYTKRKVEVVLKSAAYKEKLSLTEQRDLISYLEGVYKTSFSFEEESTIGEIIAQVILQTGDARFRIKKKDKPMKDRPIEGYPVENITHVNKCLSYVVDPNYPNTIVFVINRFREGMVVDSFREIQAAHKEKKIVFDFTENRGGSSSEKQKLIEIFLTQGVIADFVKSGVTEAKDDQGDSDEIELSSKILCFISGSTASSAESFMEPLKKQGIIITCGEKSFGKWSKNLSNPDILPNHSVKVTIDRHKEKKELEGLDPDIPSDLERDGKQQILSKWDKGELVCKKEKG